MEILHFKEFLSTKENASDICKAIQQELSTMKEEKDLYSHNRTIWGRNVSTTT